MSENQTEWRYSEFLQISFLKLSFTQDHGEDTHGTVLKPHMVNLHGSQFLTDDDWERIFDATEAFARDLIREISTRKSETDKQPKEGEL